MKTAVTTLPGSTNSIFCRDLGRIGGGVQGYCGCSEGSRCVEDDGRGMGGSYCGKVTVAVSASGFLPAVMTERIKKRRKVQRKSEHGIGEKTEGHKLRYCGER